MLQQIFGTSLDLPVRVAVALIVIAVLLGVTIMLLRAFGGGVRTGAGRSRNGARLSLVDAISLDQRRKLMLVRCDEMEHLLLVGGTNDLVVDADVGRTAPASVAAREPALAREAPSPRIAAAAQDALAQVGATRATTAEIASPAAQEVLAPPAQESKRSLGRRPLLRGDGTLSGRQPAAQAPAAAAPTRGVISRAAPPSTMPSRGPASLTAPAVEEAGHKDATPSTPDILAEASATIAAPEQEQEAAKVVASVFEAEPAARRGSEPNIDELAERLDAALAEPVAEAPRLSLSDLLDDESAAPAPVASEPETPAPAPAEEAPVRPVFKVAEPERPAPTEREAASADRFGTRGRNRDTRPVLPPLPERPERMSPAATRRDPLPRSEPAARSELRAGGSDLGMRPREFSFRSPESSPRPGREAPRLDTPRRPTFGEEENRAPTFSLREPSSLREVPSPREAASSARSSDTGLRDTFKRESERRPSEPTVRPEPVFEARRWDPLAKPAEDAARPGAAPVVAPPTAPTLDKAPAETKAPAADPLDDLDPFGDLDAEMANLLGRNSASGH